MSDERKRIRIWPCAVGLLIWLPVLYAASFGPASWLADRGIISSVELYRPLARMAAKRPGPVRDGYCWHAGFESIKESRDTAGYQMLLQEWRKIHEAVEFRR